MERLTGIVNDELGRLGAPARIGAVVSVWTQAVGDAIARNAWPARIARDGTLHVATSSSAWAFELTQLQGELLERLRAGLGEAAPARLRFAPGRVPDVSAADSEEPTNVPRPGSRERAVAAELATPIENEELRSLVARAAAASLARSASGRLV